MKQVGLILFSSALVMAVLSACTKEIPYEEVYKEDVQPKSAIDTNAEYLYSSSMLNASRTSSDALPFSFSDNKRVKLQWTKDALRILEVERDARYQANRTNDKLVLEIPVDHVDYQCAKDRYGECTNSEEEREDVSWNLKKMFKFKLEDAKSGALELLPILVSKTVGENCYEEISSKVLSIETQPDALNLQIERTFKMNLKCLPMSVDSLSDATVTAVYHHSMVKASSVLSKGFKTVSYPAKDQDTFGFFATERMVLDATHNRTETGKQTIMNHWNPDRKEIVYHLSDEFNKPENALVKELTKKTVNSLNQGLEKAGAQFRITLKDPSGKNPGDIRNSMIVLVEDPVNSGVIGYGPQTEDPVTGEIISARTVMFLGTIKSGIGSTYDRILADKRRALSEKGSADPGGSAGKQAARLALSPSLAAKTNALKKRQYALKTRYTNRFLTAPKSKVSASSTVVSSNWSLQELVKDIQNYTKRSNGLYRGPNPKAQLKYLQEAKNCAFGLNEDVFSGDISPKLAAQFSVNDKPWAQLSDSEKLRVTEILLPEVWVPTLIHELGHNLGLRHNFGGSEDKENFYSVDELKGLGIDHQVPFSSIMEYADDLRALPVPGKYDIAALKFAYAKKVETADHQILDVSTSLSDLSKAEKPVELKAYRYCTDEHAGANLGCRRFDMGTSYTQIIQNEIQSYFDTYQMRNFRNNRANLSLADDPAYATRIWNKFVGLRLTEDIYEEIKAENGFTDSSEEWSKDPVLSDIKKASILVNSFFLEVLTTADRNCAIASSKEPDKIHRLIPLSQFRKTSCFDVKLLPQFVMLGQTGKSFQSLKDADSENSFADQIDVRGYWLDKLMAARALFSRRLGHSSLDRDSSNFADRADLAGEIMSTVSGLMLNQLVGPQYFETPSGETVVADLPVETNETHIIEKPLWPEVAKSLRIPDQRVRFVHVLAWDIVKHMVDADHSIYGKVFADQFKVIRSKSIGPFHVPKGFKMMVAGSEKLIAGPENSIAYEAMALHEIATLLQKYSPARLKQIHEAMQKKETPVNLKEEEKAILQVHVDDLQAYLNGSFQSPEFYENLVVGLPREDYK